MKRLRRYILPVLSAALLLLAVRGCFVRELYLASAPGIGGYEAGDRLFVSLASYGWHCPLRRCGSDGRIGFCAPVVGDVVAYERPADGRVRIGLCRALPGMKVAIDTATCRLLPLQPATETESFTVPHHCQPVPLSPLNARMLVVLARRHEASQVKVTPSGRAVVGGVVLDSLRFSRDYYLLETHPDTFELVPHEALIGRVVGRLSF